jgi:hypothetical protein
VVGRKTHQVPANAAFQMEHITCADRAARVPAISLPPLKRGARSCRRRRSARLERPPCFGSGLFPAARPGLVESPLISQRDGNKQNRRWRILIGSSIRGSGERACIGPKRWEMT